MGLRAALLVCVVALGYCTSVAADTTARAGRVVPRTVPELLEIVEAKPGVRNPTVVRLTLRNALQFEGQVTSYDPRRGVCVIAGENGQSSIIELSDIAAVTVLNPGAAKLTLQGGLIYREQGEEPPTFISLRRAAESMAKQYKTGVSVWLPESESENLDCRFAAHRMLTALEATLKDVTADKMGQDGISKYSGGLRLLHETGARTEVKASGKYAIDVHFDCFAPLLQEYESNLARAIKKLL